MSKYGFYVWDLEAMELTANKERSIHETIHLNKTERKLKAILKRTWKS